MAVRLKDILDEAARLCSVPPVSSWISADSDEQAILRQFLMDAAAEVIDRYDFEQAPGLRLTYREVLDGVEYTAAIDSIYKATFLVRFTGFQPVVGETLKMASLSDDYKIVVIAPEGDLWRVGRRGDRNVPSGNVYRDEVRVGTSIYEGGFRAPTPTNRTALRLQRGPLAVISPDEEARGKAVRPIEGPQEWAAMEAAGAAVAGGTIYYHSGEGGGVVFRNAGGASMSVLWMTNEWITGPDPSNRQEIVPKSMFNDEQDETEFPRRALVSAVVARFRQRYGMEYLAERADFDRQISRWTDDRTQRGKWNLGGQSARPLDRGPYWVNPPAEG